MFFNSCCCRSSKALAKSSSLRLFRTSAKQFCNPKTYYEVLGLKNDCSQKDIRNSFVLLSKEHHPDVNKSKGNDEKSHEEFLRVMEAYQILSKSHSRANYDLSLKGFERVHYIKRDTVHEPWRVDPTSYSEKGPFYSPYYGVKGMKKIQNWKIVAACLVFCACGVILQGAAIIRSFTFNRDRIDRSSAIYNANHVRAREEAEQNGNVTQIERLKVKMTKSEQYYYGKSED